MVWQPNRASTPIEQEMETINLPESDRDEVRRFTEFLQRRKARKDGKELSPPPEGMREWLMGEDQQEK